VEEGPTRLERAGAEAAANCGFTAVDEFSTTVEEVPTRSEGRGRRLK
jgi:hypothetical protein